MSERMKSFTPTDLPCPVAPATRICGIDSNVLMMIEPSIAFPSGRLLSDFFISATKSEVFNTSQSLTIIGFGLGNWIPTQSVPGIGATILSDLDFNDNAISLVNHSIVEILIHESGLILICTMDGPISNPSMVIGTLNSNNLSCRALAFSIRNVSSIVTASPGFCSRSERP